MNRLPRLLALSLLCAVTPAAAQASFQGLGDLPGGLFNSLALGVSADGNVVVGRVSVTDGVEAFRWTEATGMVGLGDLPGGPHFSFATGASADGTVIVGSGETANGSRAVRWVAGGGPEALGSLPGGFTSRASGVAADGSVVAGSGLNSQGFEEAFRWTLSTGMVGLGDFPGGTSSTGLGVSADGSAIVGRGSSSSGAEAFRWTEAGGMVGLGDLPGGAFSGVATAVSGDGSVVVGQSSSTDGTEAFRWTSSTGMVGLGDVPGGGFSSSAHGVSSDGSVVVGVGVPASGEAFIWTAADGMRGLSGVLVDQGVDLTGWTLRAAHAVSADGRVVVGFGTNPQGDVEAYRAVLSGGHRWVNPAGGAWDVSSNWSTDTVPDADDPVTFDLANTYTVTGGAAPRSARALGADDGTVDFSLDNLALTSTSLDLPSLTVSFDATAKIVAGTASFVHGSVGYGFNAPGDTTTTARLQVFNAGTELVGSGFLFVGGVGGGRGEVFVAGGSLRSAGAALGAVGSIGEVIVGNDGAWTVDHLLRVGLSDVGRLFVEEGGGVSAGRLEIGSFTDPVIRSLVDVAGFGPAERSRLFVADSIIVGGTGEATLRARAGAVVTAGHVLVGGAPSPTVQVLVGGSSPQGLDAELVATSIAVGVRGAQSAFLSVSEGGSVETAQLYVGGFNSTGIVFVEGAATLLARADGFAGECYVALGGDAEGVLSIISGGLVACDQAHVGTLGIGSIFVGANGSAPAPSELVVSRVLRVGEGDQGGRLQLDGGVVDAVDAASAPPADPNDIVVFPLGRVEGVGIIHGSISNSGLIEPGVFVVPPLAPSASPDSRASESARSEGSAGGALVLNGRITMEAGATLAIPLAGPDSTQQGRLRVRPAHGMDGSAALAGTLRLDFQNAYAPANGDVFELLDAASATGTFGAVEITGLEPGWPFEVSVVNGSVVLTSLGDGVPTTFPTPAEPGAPAPAALALHAPAPNPTSGATTLRFDLPAAGRVRLALYDMLGREVAVLIDGDRPAGAHDATLTSGRLAPGVYVARLQAGRNAATRTLTVHR